MRYTPEHFAFENLEIRALLSAGSLDTSFGVGGKVITALPNVIGLNDVAVLEDQSTIATVRSGTLADSKMRLVRFGANGLLDETFGTDGVASIDFGNGQLSARQLIVQQDGKIVTVGQKSMIDNTADFAIARFLASGSPDTSFGSGGKVIVNFGEVDFATDVLQLADGKLLVVGADNAIATGLVRLNTNGTVDTSFGTSGKTSAPVDVAFGGPRLALTPDGRIIAASPGHKDVKFGSNVVRFTAGGIIDTGFSGDGIVFVQNEFYGDVFVTAQNRTVTIGYDSVGNIVVHRMIPGGGGDTTLSPTGSVSYASGANNVTITDVELQSDGKIIFVGQVGNSGEGSDFLVGRLNADLSLDASFGTNGMTRTDFKGFDAASGVDIDAFGRIVVGGDAFTSPFAGDEAGALLRLLNTEASATVVNGSFIINGTSGNDRINVALANGLFSVTITGNESFASSAPATSVTSIVVSGGAGRDRIVLDRSSPSSIVNGNTGNDTIIGGDGDDLLIGAAGNDRLDGGLGGDTLVGNAGRDTVTYEFRTAPLALAIGDIPGGSGEADELDLISNSIETLIGGGGNDRIAGSVGLNDVLYGGAGDDTLVGFSAHDTLFGGDGKDRLIGDLGSDLLDGGPGADRADDDPADQRISIESLLT